jgi:hypothetical protein
MKKRSGFLGSSFEIMKLVRLPGDIANILQELAEIRERA